MTIPILMPALSPTMETGKLAKWHVGEGDAVQPGDIIAEIETDKAAMEVEAADEGVIGKILIEEDTSDIPVNQPIAILLEEGEGEDALKDVTPASPKATTQPPPATPEPAVIPVSPTIPAHTEIHQGTRTFASPLARKIAEQKGLDLKVITGSGPDGRIVEKDVESATPIPGSGFFSEEPLDPMRATIARRLTDAKRDIPHYYLSIDCCIDRLIQTRSKLNQRLEDNEKISVNDFIIRASAHALKRVPDANASFAGNKIRKFKHADISIAVAIDGGLITPIIRKAETRSLREIAAETKELVQKARDRKLLPQDYEGGSFSISNLGMMGIKNFTAIINPPQSAILAVGAGEKRAIVSDDGSIASATMMTVTLSCDHRVIDGALGAKLLAEFKELVEDPLMMLA